MRKYYPGITLFKFFGAVLVVLAHIRQFPLNGWLNDHITGFTQFFAIIVPAFYVMSGFLAYQGWKHTRQSGRYIRRYLLWIGGAYTFFCLCYVFTDIIPLLLRGTLTYHNINYLFEGFLIIGPYWQLWFIPPLILVVACGYWAEKRGLIYKMFVLSVSGFVVSQFVCGALQPLSFKFFGDLPIYHDKHFFLIKKLVCYYLSNAFPFVIAGIYIGQNEDRFLQIHKWHIALVCLCFIAADFIILSIFHPREYTVLLSNLPMAIWLFYGILKIRNDNIKKIHPYIRQLSIFLFFTHMPLIRFNEWLMGWQHDALSLGQAAMCALLTFSQIMLIERLVVLVWRKKRPQKLEAIPVSTSQTLNN